MQTGEDREIDGHAYHVGQLPAMKGKNILLSLLKAGGSAVSKGVEPIAMIAQLVQTVDGALLDTIIKESLPLCLIDGQPFSQSMFDVHFAGDYFAMAKWLTFVLEVNYKSFFVAVTGSLKARAVVSPA
jgi:hypothetical protein